MKRRRAEASADGLALMTSSYSADGLREQSQESAVARSSRELQWIQSQASLLLYIQSTRYPDARKAKVAKLGNQTQTIAHSVESFYEPAVALYIQSQRSRRKIPVAVFEDSAEAQSSSRFESAAKQLTIYESWMSTAEQFKWQKRQDAINAQDGKNQWLRLSRANCLN
ncbi:ABC transporter B family member 25 [Dorcoceras hygrometricum]|uniref:ABC transporter B family member 25 n=1 Tax=Dorcoceras hygrometricum TaxID=472368 RepID=A0A2Z7CTV5_9LAMI|nr:ABC transporter B family member 25 [Dorcoceras hygrometricum]